MKEIKNVNEEAVVEETEMAIEVNKKAEFLSKAWKNTKKWGGRALLVTGGLLIGALVSGKSDCEVAEDEDEYVYYPSEDSSDSEDSE